MSALRWEYVIAWDGEPSMSGKPHRMSIGATFPTLAQAQHACATVPSMRDKPNVRIERRQVGPWEACS